MATLPLPTNIVVGQTGHDTLHNNIGTAVNLIADTDAKATGTGTGLVVKQTSPTLITPAITGAISQTGNADTQQLVIRANATQTGNIVLIQDSTGNNYYRMSQTGSSIFQARSATNNAALDSLTTAAGLTTGTPAANFGTSLVFSADDTTSPLVTMMRIRVQWIDPTHASRTVMARFRLTDSGGDRIPLEMAANGSAPLIGFLGATAIVRQTFGAATAGGTYTANEQTMLQKCYDAFRNFGLGT